MIRKHLAIFFLCFLATTYLFSTPTYNKTIVINASKLSKPYEFIIQYDNSGDGNSATATDVGDLSSTINTTKAFTVETKKDGNVHDRINFKTEIKTGKFLRTDGSSIEKYWYPTIIDDSSNITHMPHHEDVTYHSGTNGNFENESTCYYTVEFKPGKHKTGTEIARFILEYKADETLIAGDYESNSTVSITTE